VKALHYPFHFTVKYAIAFKIMFLGYTHSIAIKRKPRFIEPRYWSRHRRDWMLDVYRESSPFFSSSISIKDQPDNTSADDVELRNGCPRIFS